MRIDIGQMNGFLSDAKGQLAAERAKIFGITISADPTPQQMKKIVADLDASYTPLRVSFGRVKTFRTNLESFIDSIEKMANLGKNADERKANAATAVNEYKIPATEKSPEITINLYEKLGEVIHVYNQYDALLDIVDKKHQRLILDSAILKVESNLQQ